MGSRLGKPNKVLNPKTAPTKSPTLIDIAWAAGIWEGEGSISRSRPTRPSMTINVVQKDPWILHKLKALFGGGVYYRSPNAKCVCHIWNLSGPRGLGFIQTIFPFLSPRRREQVKRIILN